MKWRILRETQHLSFLLVGYLLLPIFFGQGRIDWGSLLKLFGAAAIIYLVVLRILTWRKKPGTPERGFLAWSLCGLIMMLIYGLFVIYPAYSADLYGLSPLEISTGHFDVPFYSHITHHNLLGLISVFNILLLWLVMFPVSLLVASRQMVRKELSRKERAWRVALVLLLMVAIVVSWHISDQWLAWYMD
jgi:hypothetical protein